ncbi:hypothetical protein B0H66DRAFT_297508 [Apodospora peruviana]|uniref:Leucine-rich repeat-containing protein 40 n=1 Tax=Apodospora peruviana TaxID=516989 RepID=A0AAE0M2N8_9PEZI|nr:hypothetical protein B0H66DRAFT_297508 [Apodospora peruviana]
MDNSKPSTGSGIPRPASKLPLQSSKLPVPRSSALRAIPSRETLATSSKQTNTGPVGSSLRNPRLRPAPSRDQLVSSAAATAPNRTQTTATPLRTVSTPQTRGTGILPPPTQLSQPLGNAPRTSKYSPNVAPSQRFGRTGSDQLVQNPRPSSVARGIPRRQPSQQWISAATTASGAASGEETAFESYEPTSVPRGTPCRQPSQQWISAATTAPAEQATHESYESSTTPAGTPIKLVDDAAYENIRTSSFKPRLSLAERTIETLSQLPSSPAVRGRAGAASFFDPGSTKKNAPSRSPSRLSRPGSGHQSDGSSHGRPGPGSRPSSSSGQEEAVSNFTSSISAYKSSLSTIHGTPTIQGTPLRGRQSMQSLQGPSAKGTPGLPVRSLGPRTTNESIGFGFGRSRTPSPDKRVGDVPASIFGSKTVVARPTKRPSLNGLFGNPSASTTAKPTSAETPQRMGFGLASRKARVTPREPATSSGLATASPGKAVTTDSAESAPLQNSRKSSAALREQIAQAKAAKRTVSNHIPTTNTVFESPKESPLIPKDSTFDFGLVSDPFNVKRDEKSQDKLLKDRIETARTSGRLNISMMGLKQIPSAVLDMYNLDSIDRPGGAWAESVDLTRFVAADNEFEEFDDAAFPDVDPEEHVADEDYQGNIFAGLETLDIHRNMLIVLPLGLRRLPLLTFLNLSQNRLANNCLDVISQIPCLRELKLGGNLLHGPLEPCITHLVDLQLLDLHGNSLTSLPSDLANMVKLRTLDVSENGLVSLPLDSIARMSSLVEFTASKNQLSGTLFPDSVDSFPTIKILDVSCNQLSNFCSTDKSIDMPNIQNLQVSMNRLQALPDMSSWANLETIIAEDNSIAVIPPGFTKLMKLRIAQFSSNDIRVLPAEIGLMECLSELVLSANPLREKKFIHAPFEELKSILAGRLEPPPAAVAAPVAASAGSDRDGGWEHVPAGGVEVDDGHSDTDDFATPPTSAPGSPVAPRSRARTLTEQNWEVRPPGVLDRSNTKSASLYPPKCAQLAKSHKIYEVQLHNNLFSVLPDSLSHFESTLTSLSLAHNKLVGELYMGDPDGNEGLELPALTELNLSHNWITGLAPLVAYLDAPKLQKLDVSHNRIASLPQGTQLRDAFPELTVLLVANNHLSDLEPDNIKGMRVVDAHHNDIAHLNPRLGLLGGPGGCLERLDVTENRFRVPRYSVLEMGTEATLRYLRKRVPVAELGAWRGDEGFGEDDVD